MPFNDHKTQQHLPANIAKQAAMWLVRRDRGLTSEEQDAYLQWISADHRHSEAMNQHSAAFERMMHLYEWQPVHTTEPNPDLFAPPPSPPRFRWWIPSFSLIAAAAAVVIGIFVLRSPEPVESPAPPAARTSSSPMSHLRVNERMALPDGSRVELRDGTKLVVQYSETERRVKLLVGEAQFSVWKDPIRPFVVEASGVEVLAIGTVFNVRIDHSEVGVLVTEGRVKVEPEATANRETTAPPTNLLVVAGEKAKVSLAESEGPAIQEISKATPEEIYEAIAWQAPRLQFSDTPLYEAVAEFNRLNRHQIIIGDPELRLRVVGGTFRPDNVDSFIRLLCTTFDIRAEKVGKERTVLRCAN